MTIVDRPSVMLWRKACLVALVLAAVSSTACGGDSTGTRPKGHDSTKAGQCSRDSGTITAFDISGPGQPTLEEALAPYLGSFSIVSVDATERSATVTAETADGGKVRVYELTRHEDGWWPDGYLQCPPV